MMKMTTMTGRMMKIMGTMNSSPLINIPNYDMKTTYTKIQEEKIISGVKRRYKISGYKVTEIWWDPKEQKTLEKNHEQWYLFKEVKILWLFRDWWQVGSGRWYGYSEYDREERKWFDSENSVISMIKYLET